LEDAEEKKKVPKKKRRAGSPADSKRYKRYKKYKKYKTILVQPWYYLEHA
jgi:hypothetical protein